MRGRPRTGVICTAAGSIITTRNGLRRAKKSLQPIPGNDTYIKHDRPSACRVRGYSLSALRLVWPFLAVADADGRSTGWCVLSGPVRTQSDLDTYRELRSSFRFIGFTSYTTFPSVEEGIVSDYEALCEGWCHCFRKPDLYISSQTPKELISESDFVD